MESNTDRPMGFPSSHHSPSREITNSERKLYYLNGSQSKHNALLGYHETVVKSSQPYGEQHWQAYGVSFIAGKPGKIKNSGKKCYLNCSQRKHNALMVLSWDESCTPEYCSKRNGLVPSKVKILKLSFNHNSLRCFRLKVTGPQGEYCNYSISRNLEFLMMLGVVI